LIGILVYLVPDIHKFAECEAGKFSSFFSFKLCLEELKEIIKSANVNSSPGPDLIDYQRY